MRIYLKAVERTMKFTRNFYESQKMEKYIYSKYNRNIFNLKILLHYIYNDNKLFLTLTSTVVNFFTYNLNLL
jgi:hypothetical protein